MSQTDSAKQIQQNTKQLNERAKLVSNSFKHISQILQNNSHNKFKRFSRDDKTIPNDSNNQRNLKCFEQFQNNHKQATTRSINITNSHKQVSVETATLLSSLP